MNLFEITTEGAANLRARLQQAKEGLDLSYFVNKRPTFSMDETGIAHVWVHGPLLQDAAPVEKDLGATDYGDLAAEISAEGAKAILLHVDSPGGTVAGCIEVAQLIAEASVPVVAFVHGMACSAAYKIACGADYMVASPSATVGNIGTILVYADTSAMMANLGVSLNAITNEGATLKATGHLDSLTEEQKQFLQDGINEAGKEFQDHVAANRPGIDPEVWRAGWYSGNRALSLGLVDELGSEATAVERLRELVVLTNEQNS
ncbi:S49 family peptidase [Haloferula sp. BvORR071]|uniref:S49 family peptidase n=1 Tax=Haloferula sp. BvORR071 TaxID=1396141 RepID=UPI0005543F32|nr:S49 family peptidase [Haloferula sp. BvORR071]